MKKLFILLALLFSAQWLFAQETQSPLPLYISGSGTVAPFQDGQLLDNGRHYVMEAIPDSGYVFTNWQPVYVYTAIIYFYDVNDQFTSMTNIDVSPDNTGYVNHRVLNFVMQPEQEIAYVPNFLVITMSQGWQANFVPAPQKRHQE